MCRVENCTRTVVAFGLCLRHLAEARRNGDPSAFSATWDRCPHGHPMTVENTMVVVGNQRGSTITQRRCRACHVESTRRWRG